MNNELATSNKKETSPFRTGYRRVIGVDVAKNNLDLCESTASYHLLMTDMALEKSIDVAIVNPRQVRDFAKGHGWLEKTDTIDAAMISRFGQDVEVHLAVQRTEQQKNQILKELAKVVPMWKFCEATPVSAWSRSVCF